MSFGVDDDGRFNKKDVVTIREDLRQHVQNELPEDVSLQQNSPIQQLIDAFAIEISRQWDAAEDTYFSSFFVDAEGEQLDKQLALAGFSRRELQSATGVVVFSRDSPAPRNITISEGTRVAVPATQTRPSIPFVTTAEVTLFAGETETNEVQISGVPPWQFNTQPDERQIGEGTNVEKGEISEIVDSVSGIDSVSNPVGTGSLGREDFQIGRDRETDSEFKLRYQNSLAEGGVSTAPAMESSIFQFDERIESVRVDEIRDTEIGYGPKVTVFAPRLFDGSVDNPNDIVAQAILESRGAGVESFGSEVGTAESTFGLTREEHFETADEVTITVDITLTTSDTYPSDGDERITDNLIQFIGGTDLSGTTYRGLDIGDDVVFDQVKRRVMEVRGVVQADVDIGVSGEVLDNTNIDIGELEVPMTDATEVSISE